MIKYRNSVLIVMILFLLSLSSCGKVFSSNDKNEEVQLEIITSFPVMTLLTENLITENEIVTQLSNSDVDVKNYEITDADIKKIANCDLFIVG